jgi:hypothetical protein
VKPAALCVVAACSYWNGPVDLPEVGTTTPAHVPLDLAWETPLVVYSGGSPAPMGVTDATGTCAPADACAVFTVPPTVTNDDPKLVVVGMKPGPASVELRYVQPKQHDTRTAHLQLVFEPAEQIDTVSIGQPAPTRPFLFAFQRRMLRCEPHDGRYLCFPLEVHGGQQRYPACSQSTRCSIRPAGYVVNGYILDLTIDGGNVSGAAIYGGESDAHAPLETWP